MRNVIEESLDAFQDIANDKRIGLHYHSPEKPVYIQANAIKLDLALSNIVKNAIDASERTENPRIDIQLSVNDSDDALITISDNGGGIDEHTLQKLFSPYFTTKEVGKGLGLGLSITYEIIQEYYGKIEVSNTQDGACFIISLPIKKEKNHGKNA